MTVSPQLILYGRLRETNSNFLTVRDAKGDIPSPVAGERASTSPVHVVIVSGTVVEYTA